MIKELSKIKYKNYNIFYGESHDEMEMKKFYAVNQEFLEGDRIQRLHFMLQRIYKYLLYTEWIDANLKLVW